MYCSRCGARNDDDAKFCDRCGADLGAMPKPTLTGAPPVPVGPPPPTAGPMPPPYVYPPARRRAWWYPMGVWVLLAAFFAFVDLTTTHTISLSILPIGILGIFMVGIPLLNLLEERTTRRR